MRDFAVAKLRKFSQVHAISHWRQPVHLLGSRWRDFCMAEPPAGGLRGTADIIAPLAGGGRTFFEPPRSSGATFRGRRRRFALLCTWLRRERTARREDGMNKTLNTLLTG